MDADIISYMEGKISNLDTIQPKCYSCGAELSFAPGSESLECPYCGALNKIDSAKNDDIGDDYKKILKDLEENEEFIENFTAKCNSCGSQFEIDGDISSTECPFCASPVIVEGGSTRRIKPKAILPFKVTREKAKSLFKKWVKKLWFAPKELKVTVLQKEKLNGIYIPYWVYDVNAISYYDGERGSDHKETESYTTYEDGKEVSKTNEITVTDWSPASGVIYNPFTGILIPGTGTIPENLLKSIDNWDLKELKNFNEEFISGFKAECYTTGVVKGFSEAVKKTGERIRSLIKNDIGGDHQKINSVRTTYDKIKFKHILFPIWISSFRFGKKSYKFLINGSTGKIYGERPWSLKKIFYLIISVIIIITAAILIF